MVMKPEVGKCLIGKHLVGKRPGMKNIRLAGKRDCVCMHSHTGIEESNSANGNFQVIFLLGHFLDTLMLLHL